MTLALDERRLAMLREMGLRLLPPASPTTAASLAATPETEVGAGALLPALGAEKQHEAPARHDPEPLRAPQSPAAPLVARVVDDRAGLGWDELRTAVAACTACGLSGTRRQTVFGAGPARADWMVIGDPPDEHEDAQGEPFAGPPGQLLDSMLRAIGLDRQRNVSIANVLKCRAPAGRNPEPQEAAQCESFLRRQVELVQPRIILVMGRFAVQTLLRTQEPIGRLRGRPHEYQGVPVVVTYHPAYLLRNLADKGKAWADLCLAMDLMDGRG
ncbi:MAG TPA: uracil-DNA glycosylase [Ramlibacter sp.]|jgi:DNA polymerase|uniref:uracil-DNA glycosylase n=1 Tax=Ramlibacter sp. TaxID=1917967 RepID=UPI002D520E00|nr:uracil-DNA glycosylase [Ramlibacter sp.]HZY17080.1 uracil-DNA glycosylase [Ramlibacter sp.]